MAVRIGIVGAGKMGLSHFAIANAHPKASVVAVCDTSRYVLSVLRKYAKVATWSDWEAMMDEAGLDAVIVSTPTSTHYRCAEQALERGLHVFVEKPLTLSHFESRALAELGERRRRVNQVGFHNRFLGTFREARRLVRAGALGAVTRIRGSAFGQVVVKEQATTWRSRRAEGGGCLSDYASHVVDLMNFVVGPPTRVTSASLESIFSRDVDDAVHATFAYADGASGVLEANWSDPRFRKMTTTLAIEGSGGTLVVDRQELKADLAQPFDGYPAGGSSRYITALQPPVGYYLRGEEYSAQLDAFIEGISSGSRACENSFASACETDRILALVDQASRAGGGQEAHT
ncbi:MAG TPA: Gfo/Idh/MocA family oxidoreductase [Anaeromyxobacteraceae bacterium]|nr:Gfo/Idh/MocA family oxidoreductase [Anaeromyxobacteraceae bacterium]